MSEKKKVGLIILDGWGIGKHDKADAIFNSKTPYFNSLMDKYPHAQLLTDGENVGLPKGQMGNSEVGHMNIGAGRIVFQDLVKIDKAVENNELGQNQILKEALDDAKKRGVDLHFMGLLSDGGVHSSQEHLHALLDIAERNGNEQVFVHAFMDGRDCDPQSGKGFLQKLSDFIADKHSKIATVIGRYYAMDRDKRWERIKKAYDMMVKGEGHKALDPVEAIASSYKHGITDEFIDAIVLSDMEGDPVTTIKEGDVVIVFNFRTDRCREITIALTQQDFPEYGMKTIPLNYVTMTRYDDSYKGIKVLFEKDNLEETIGEVIAKNGLTQLRIAETEKYPHVTFFFNGGRETPFDGENRIVINSPKVATYDLQPEMSAPEVANAACTFLEENRPDLMVLNFANPDMVGHTGVYSAIQKAVETVDSTLKQVVEKGLSLGYSFIIIADHGNSDNAINPDGTPNTAHSLNPVPIIVIDKDVHEVKNGVLADVAPSILKIMGVQKAASMKGRELV
jgi:2,3-bisphosphoglycerate-independent phosphoglycerate mutase